MSTRAQTARGYRYRPAPRRRGSARVSGIRWDRIGRTILLVFLAVIVLLYIRPGLNVLDTWGEKRAEQAHVAELEREQARLKRQLAGLSEPGAIEQQAREMGMIAPGERPYAVRGLDDAR
jgi:cell division protein FtsB